MWNAAAAVVLKAAASSATTTRLPTNTAAAAIVLSILLVSDSVNCVVVDENKNSGREKRDDVSVAPQDMRKSKIDSLQFRSTLSQSRERRTEVMFQQP